MPLPRVILSLLCVIWATCASAQDAFLDLQDQPRWNAVGRITRDGPQGRTGCSGVLIAPRYVLTAGHCAGGFAGAAPERIARLGFAAGLHGDRTAGFAQAIKVTTAPDWTRAPLTPQTIPDDLALIELSDPMPGVAALPIGPLPGFEDPLGYVGYVNAFPRSARIQRECAFRLPAPGLVALNCPVVSGNSGAPVLADIDGTPTVVAIVSAKGPQGAFAAEIPDWVFVAVRD